MLHAIVQPDGRGDAAAVDAGRRRCIVDNAVSRHRCRCHALAVEPAGALSVFPLLFVLCVQVVTGLFVDDEIAFQGPLAKYAPSAIVSFLSEIHEGNQVIIYTLITIHIAAIWYYKKFKGENLIKPMISGDKEIDPSEEANYLPSDLGHSSKDGALQRGLAFLLLSLIAVAVGYFITR